MRVSVLLPVRETEPLLLTRVINNLLDTAEDPEEVEIIVCLDDDDPMGEAMKEEILYGLRESVSFIQVHRYLGYKSLHRQWNACAKSSIGHWLMLWNCDAIMLTENWDTKLDAFKDPICVVRPSDNHNAAAFVIFPRLVYDLLGHITKHPFMDWWINQLIYRQGGWPAHEPDIRVHHRWTRQSPNAKASLELQDDLHKGRPTYWRGLVDRDVANLRKAHEDSIRLGL